MLAPKKNNILSNQKEAAEKAYKYAITMTVFNSLAFGGATVGGFICYFRKSDHSGEQITGLNNTQTYINQETRIQSLDNTVLSLATAIAALNVRIQELDQEVATSNSKILSQQEEIQI